MCNKADLGVLILAIGIFGFQPLKSSVLNEKVESLPLVVIDAPPQNKEIGPNEAGNTSWGFKFTLPDGWVSQMTEDGILLGHNTISGLLFVMPHQAQNLQNMKQEMQEGIQEGGTYLTLSGGLQAINANTFSTEYSGVVDGTNAKAKGYGVLSPYGGGAYILAISTPEMLREDIITAAHQIAQNINFFKSTIPEIAHYFEGKWTTFSTNTTTSIYLYANGLYSENYEATYSGNFENGGTNTGNWGASNQSSDQGKWTIKGTKDHGQIIVTLNNGNQVLYNYQVHSENGQTFYSEYWINGSLYSKSGLE